MSLSPDLIYTEEQLFSRLKVDGLEVKDDLVERARDGDSDAICDIGEIYHGQMNYMMSKLWFSKSAAQENSKAQARLGTIYFDGLGVTSDRATAQKWFEKAAAQGNTDAEIAIGNSHKHGWQVPVNRKIALEWYFKAAIRKSPEAFERIGSVLHIENKKQAALAWYQRSADMGCEKGKKALENLLKENFSLDIDQKNLLSIEERLCQLEIKNEVPSSIADDDQEGYSNEFKSIMKIMNANKKKLDEANEMITVLEKTNQELKSSFDKKTHRMKKKISTLEDKCHENGKLKEKIIVLESEIMQSKRLEERVKLLERLMANIKNDVLSVDDIFSSSSTSTSPVNSEPESISFGKIKK